MRERLGEIKEARQKARGEGRGKKRRRKEFHIGKNLLLKGIDFGGEGLGAAGASCIGGGLMRVGGEQTWKGRNEARDG